ncbi:IQ domain-containing protein IQM2 [Linum perenne]
MICSPFKRNGFSTIFHFQFAKIRNCFLLFTIYIKKKRCIPKFPMTTAAATLSTRMGISFSCPFGNVENVLDSVIVKSISFGDDDQAKTPVRSVSFGKSDLEPTISSKSSSPSGEKMVVERSVSLKGLDFDKMTNSIQNKELHSPDNDDALLEEIQIPQKLPVFDPGNPKHQAAVKLQKVYKSFRTRRKLADCAVLVEQSWSKCEVVTCFRWKLLDFAELKHSSISFFDIEKHETAISRWSRARTRAAKVGKGLSKNGKAQKLALQHWLEAIDPRHRYGHNLHFYYDNWLHSKSREPFFYWLDIGEGKEVNIVEKCPRWKLQQQCIKYLGPMERKAYEVVVEDGRLMYKETGEFLNTTGDSKWIFVLSTSKTLYVGQKKKGTFQHSSFLAGGVATAAGRLIAEEGVLKAVWPHSGHYRPTEENFRDFLSFLIENNVDLTDVKTSPMDEEDGSLSKQRSSKHLRNHSEDDFIEAVDENLTSVVSSNPVELIEEEEEGEVLSNAVVERHKPEGLVNFGKKLTSLEIPERPDDLLFDHWSDPTHHSTEDGYESAEEEGEAVPREAILERINSKKGMQSYQLGKQLSCKWTTGAGPRIGCVRDYPSELQFRALEQVNLSPRCSPSSRGLSLPAGYGIEGMMDTATTVVDSPSFSRLNRFSQSLPFSRAQCSSPLSLAMT